MATIKKLKRILEILEAAGIGNEAVCAEHDQIFLVVPDKFAEDSEVSKKLTAAGALFDENDGWYIFT